MFKLIETHIEVENLENSLKLYQQLIPHKKCLKWADDKVAALVLEDGSAFGIWKTGHKGIHEGRGGKHVHFAFQIDEKEYETYRNKITSLKLKPLEYEWEKGHKSV